MGGTGFIARYVMLESLNTVTLVFFCYRAPSLPLTLLLQESYPSLTGWNPLAAS